MYCTTCGNEVPFGDSYCPYDGTFQLQDQQPHVTSGATPKFCSECGTSNTDEHLYCFQCGAFQLTLIPYKFERVKENGTASAQVIPDFSRLNKKMAVLCAFLAFLMVGIASFIVAQSFKEQASTFQAAMEDYTDISPYGLLSDIFYSFDETELPTNPFTGTSDFWMSSHLLNSKLSVDLNSDFETFKGGVHLQSGPLILLLLPLLALLCSGYFYGRRNRMDTQQYWISSLLIGITYGVLTAIVAIFSGFSFKGTTTGITTASLVIENNYPFFKALVTGFFIGTIFSFIGCLFGSGTLKSLTSSPLKEGLRTITIGISASIVVVIVLLYRLLFGDFAGIGFENIPTSAFLVIAVQGGFLLWNILNLSPLSIEWDGFGDRAQMTFSSLSGMNTMPSNELAMLITNFGNLRLYMMLGLLIPIALFVWAGYRMQQEGDIQFLRLTLFGFLYALLMSLLAAGTNSGIEFFSSMNVDDIEDAPRLFIGFSAIATFFKCFIFSTLLAIVGAYWKKQRGNRGQART